MRFLTLNEVLAVHRLLIAQSGGTLGIRDRGGLESAVVQPQMSFGGEELYPGLVEKAAALGFSLVKNHPFLDGNKRVGHAALETFLVLNGYEVEAPVDEQEAVVFRLASGEMDRDEFTAWLRSHIMPRPPS